MSIATYIKETRAEMSHVNWPTRVQTIKFTLLVIGVSAGTAIILGVSDFVFTQLLKLVF